MLAAATLLGGLALARRWIQRAPTMATTTAVRLDAGDCVRAVAPMLRDAGCATAACHGAPGATLALSAALGTAGDVIAACDALGRRVVPGNVSQSALYQRATTSHAGGAALDPNGCHARQLARWIRGERVEGCGVTGGAAGSAPSTMAPR